MTAIDRTAYPTFASLPLHQKAMPFPQGGKEFAAQIAAESAQVQNYPADIINRVLEELLLKRYELPAYSQIDRLVKQTRQQVNQRIFHRVHQQLPSITKKKFSSLTITATRTAYNKLKELPKSTSINHFNHYTGWANVFGPQSGSDPKIPNAVERYILTTFAYGTGMGPTQAAQHMQHHVSAHMLSWANQRHVTSAMQNKAIVKIINRYKLFDLPKNWGTGKRAIADGTMRKIYQENLTAEMHIRYGGTGGIAYHHIADNYIALFSTFIPCGVWEAVEIIEGLLKNESDIQPTIVHADTQGQSTVVFAIAYMLGISLMPRIRNWKDMKFHRPSKKARYKHIDSLFKDTKAVKYNDIIANAVMFHNVLDMSNVILELHEEGYPVNMKGLGRTSPLLTDHLNRLGKYVANLHVCRHAPKLHICPFSVS